MKKSLKKISLNKILAICFSIIMLTSSLTACNQPLQTVKLEAKKENNIKDNLLYIPTEKINLNDMQQNYANIIDSWQKFEAAGVLNNQETIESREYKYIRPVKIETKETLMGQIIKDSWKVNTLQSLLEKDYVSYNSYIVYFEKGIKIKNVTNQIFNIVFNERYKEQVTPGIYTSSSRKEVEAVLGKPHFSDDQNSVYGYKTDKFYIFFSRTQNGNEISIYRRNMEYNKNVLETAIKSFVKDKSKDSLLKTLTEGWTDKDFSNGISANNFDAFVSRGVYLQYDMPDKVEKLDMWIFSNYEGGISKGISLPENIKGINIFKDENIHFCLDRDSVFETEKFRIKKDVEMKITGEKSPNGKMIANYVNAGSMSPDGLIYIEYIDGNEQNIEIEGAFYADSFKWINDRYLFISKPYLCIYDLENKEFLKLQTSIEINGTETKINKEEILISDEYGKTQSILFRFDNKGSINFYIKCE